MSLLLTAGTIVEDNVINPYGYCDGTVTVIFRVPVGGVDWKVRVCPETS